MFDKNYLKLELNKIVDILEHYCSTETGKKLLHELEPSNNKLIVKHLLSETNQAVSMLCQYGAPSFYNIKFNTNLLQKIIESQSDLSPSAIISVGKILKNATELKNYFSNADNQLFEALECYFSALYTNSTLEQRILTSIIDENTIADEASANLKKLRQTKHSLEATIKENLNKYIHSSSYSKFIMEPIITIRNNRYVIPVKVEYKDNIKGFIHDMSYSGSTVYIEPISVFEMNNKIHNIELEENVEIEKILHNFSEQIFEIEESIKQDICSISNLDLIFAKAKFSKDNDCIMPIINDEEEIDLRAARHPLIDKKQVVPIDIEIGSKYKSLIITGPNTGGKTVCLKTTGLICLMAYMGILIPTKVGSSLYVFDHIYADIGDEQSIQESLSTFSSHMLNIVDIYHKATDKSLILVDELGSGTDPLQGANLAISILEYFYNLGAVALATTHYHEIKNYALVTEGFENASSEFDIENLRPTYKLLVGVPGKSNAFAITKKLGMPEEILTRANSLMENDEVNVEELIKNIYDDKVEIEKEKKEIEQNLNQIETLRKSLERSNNDLEERQNKLLEKAKDEAKEILEKAKLNASKLISDLNDIKSSNTALKDANNIRNKINNEIQKISGLSASNADAKSIANADNRSIKPEDITCGMNVRVKTLNQEATVLSLPNKSGEIQVQIGMMKMVVKLNNIDINSNLNFKQSNNLSSKNNSNKKNNFNLTSASNKSSRASTSVHFANGSTKSKNVSSEINVIGETVDEATFVIDKFLDDAYLAKIKNVRIVHGKGTGKLRKGIHQFLNHHPHVKSYRMGTFGEGEMGVTIVELK